MTRLTVTRVRYRVPGHESGTFEFDGIFRNLTLTTACLAKSPPSLESNTILFVQRLTTIWKMQMMNATYMSITILLALFSFSSSFQNVEVSVDSPDFMKTRPRGAQEQHRALSSTDYDVACQQMKGVYTNCACNEASSIALGVQGTSAFVTCTGINVQGNASANFSGTDFALYSINECQYDACYFLRYQNEVPVACNITLLPGGQQCNSCQVCAPQNGTQAFTTGLSVDCSNVQSSQAAKVSTNGTCMPTYQILQYDFQNPTSGVSSMFGTITTGLLGILAAFSVAW